MELFNFGMHIVYIKRNLVLLNTTVECSLGFGQGSQQMLGDPFPGVRKPMSPVTAQVRLNVFCLMCVNLFLYCVV